MEYTWRWFGPDDPISLDEVRQTDATGIVTALHQIPNGEVWTTADILERASMIAAAGLRWSVVESVPVHDDIKRGGPRRQRAIDNYAQTLRNLGAAGIDTVCYNFMPVLDWTRTDLAWSLPNGGLALRFDHDAYAAFDLFVLRRRGAEDDYAAPERERAESYFRQLDGPGIESLTATILAGLPGSEETYTLDSFRRALQTYRDVDAAALRANLLAFLEEILPVAEEAGIRLAIHPDDPPRPLFGLPRIVSTEADVTALFEGAPSKANGLTLCVGSFGSAPMNDPVMLARRFSSRVYFAHLRNVTVEDDGQSFYEADHLGGGVDMVSVIAELCAEQDRREAAGDQRSLPIRPDHGHVLLDDRTRVTRPGYSLIGRFKGLAQLRAVESTIRTLHALEPSSTETTLSTSPAAERSVLAGTARAHGSSQDR